MAEDSDTLNLEGLSPETAGTNAATALGGLALGTPGVIGGVAPGTPGKKGETSEDIFQRLRNLAIDKTDQRQQQFQEAATTANRRISGSPIELLSGLHGQIRGLREQLTQRYQAASRSLGPAGGRQIEAAQGEALGQAGSQLQSMFQQYLAGGTTGLSQLLQGLQPALGKQVPQPYTVETQQPPNYDWLKELVQSLGYAYQTYRGAPSGGGATTPTTIGTGYTPPAGGFSGGYGEFLRTQY